MKPTLGPLGALLFAFVGFSQVLAAQAPNGTRTTPTIAETQKINDAEQAAQDIVNHLSGNAKTKAEENLKAWREAKKAGRFVIGIPIEGKSAPRGFTWPDTPYDGSLTPQEAAKTGSYKPGQTGIQYTSLADWFLARACPCAVAVVLLHEGHRLNQDLPASNPADPPSVMFSQIVFQAANEQQMATNDLLDIQAAREVCQGTDPKCKTELDELEKKARGFLDEANKAADFMSFLGYPLASVPAPYPPTYR